MGGGAATAAGGDPGGSCGMSWPDRVALGSPFQLKPSLSGTYCSLLSHNFTVGARLPGTVSHGMFRAPRTLSGESGGTRQYRTPAGRSGKSPDVGMRRCWAARDPLLDRRARVK